MKIKSFLAIAGASLMLAACQNAPQSKSIADLKDATAADSLIYYFGQMRGAEYVRQMERDTTLATDQAKKAYVQGVQAGLNAAKLNDDAYNQGLFLGMQMAMNMKQFKDEYDVTLNKRLFIESLSEAINADSTADAREMQREFYRIMGDFNNQKETREKEAASITLSKEATEMKLPKISDEVYGKVTSKTDGEAIKNGDVVEMEATYAKSNGEAIEVPFPTKGKIGARNIPASLNEILRTMKSGESGKYITSARALFGQRCSQLGLEPSDVVTINMKATIAAPEEKAEEKPVLPVRR